MIDVTPGMAVPRLCHVTRVPVGYVPIDPTMNQRDWAVEMKESSIEHDGVVIARSVQVIVTFQSDEEARRFIQSAWPTRFSGAR